MNRIDANVSGHPLWLVVDHIRPHRRRYAVGLFLLLVTNALGAVLPWMSKLIIEAIESKQPVTHLVGWMLVVAAGMAGVRIASRIHILGASRHVAADVRATVYGHLERLSRSFYDHARSGDLLSRVTGDVQLMRGVTGFGLLNIMNTAIAVVLAGAMMFRIDAGLALGAFLPYLLLIVIARRFARRVHARTFEAQSRLAELTAFVGERFSGFSVVRTFGREDETLEGFERCNEAYLRSSLSLVQARGVMVPLFSLVGGVGILVVLWLGGSRVARGSLGLGDFVAAAGYLGMAAWPMLALGWIINLVQRAGAAARRLQHVLGTVPDVVDTASGEESEVRASGLAQASAPRGGVSIRNLSFAYGDSGRGDALRDLSIEIPPGTTLGITGPVGSGKTTLVSLLARHYALPRGLIRIDGRDLIDIPLAELRRRVAFVPQQPFLFYRSIRENIGFGLDEPIGDSALEHAASLAGLAQIATELPRGYDSPVGERGMALSGGQRQRVSLARAIACDPEILVLDDPFSAVDAQTEDEVLRGIRRFLAQRTVILVSHRTKSLMAADRILVLDRGREVGLGVHEELLVDEAGLYAKLHRRAEITRSLEDEGPRGEPAPESDADSAPNGANP